MVLKLRILKHKATLQSYFHLLVIRMIPYAESGLWHSFFNCQCFIVFIATDNALNQAAILSRRYSVSLFFLLHNSFVTLYLRIGWIFSWQNLLQLKRGNCFHPFKWLFFIILTWIWLAAYIIWNLRLISLAFNDWLCASPYVWTQGFESSALCFSLLIVLDADRWNLLDRLSNFYPIKRQSSLSESIQKLWFRHFSKITNFVLLFVVDFHRSFNRLVNVLINLWLVAQDAVGETF